jgi:acetoin utilization protein AcuC
VSGRGVFVHDAALEEYGFGGDHPFNPVRLRMTIELCESLGLLDGYPFVAPEPATEEDLRTVHYASYVRRVQLAGRGEGNLEELMQYGLGTQDNPIFPDVHFACAHVVGGTLRAARLVMDGEAEHALSISGGLHHALRAKASGFCIYNDAGVAIARLKEEHPGIKIAYVDTDVHHGDGVQWMFYDDPDVLTVSMHESGRYLFPGTGGLKETGQREGHGYSVNLPLEPFTQDASFIECFEAVVPEDPCLRARPAARTRSRARAVRRPLGRNRRRRIRYLARGSTGLDRPLGRRLPPGDARRDARRLALEVGRGEPRAIAGPHPRRTGQLSAHRARRADRGPQPPGGQ